MLHMTSANTPTARLRPMLAQLRARIANDSGATAIEYALIAAGIGAAVAATVYSLGTATKSLYSTLASML
jgi:pilus assembly protein Flp/PilA